MSEDRQLPSQGAVAQASANGPEPEWKSLAVIRAEVDIERQRLESILDSLDARAGLLLGFSGALSTFAVLQGVGGYVGAVVASVAAVLSSMVLWPRTQSVMDTESVFRQYIYKESDETAKEALRRRQKNLKHNDDLRDSKVKRFKQASVALIIAIAVTVLGLGVQEIVNAVTN